MVNPRKKPSKMSATSINLEKRKEEVKKQFQTIEKAESNPEAAAIIAKHVAAHLPAEEVTMEPEDIILKREREAMDARRERMARNQYEQQLNLFEQGGVPITPTGTAPMNNQLARSPLFSPVKTRGKYATKRPMCNKKKLAAQHDVTLYYTGEVLDMRDEDVFLCALSLAGGKKFYDPDKELHPLEYKVYVNRAQFCEALGIAKSGPNYKIIENSFFRLSRASIDLETKDYHCNFNLLSPIEHDRKGGGYSFYVPYSSIAFFLDNAYGFVNMSRRLQITSRVELSKWLQTYATSHTKERPHKIGLEKLKSYSEYNGRLRDFRIAVKDALSELLRIKEFVTGYIDDRDIVHFQRNPVDRD